MIRYQDFNFDMISIRYLKYRDIDIDIDIFKMISM